MTSTLENINTTLTVRADALSAILEIYDNYDFDARTLATISSALARLREAMTNYELASLPYLFEYYANKSSPTKRAKISRRYMNFIIAEGVIDTMRSVFDVCTQLQAEYTVEPERVKELSAAFAKSHIAIVFTNDTSNNCHCGTKFSLESKTSENVCRSCGVTETLRGMCFEDNYASAGMTGRSRHGRYDTNKHCKSTLDKIQGRERVQIPPDVISRLQRYIAKNRTMIEHISCASIRQYLKTLGLSKFNEHIPLIWSMITENTLEQLTEDELSTFYTNFAQIIQIYNKVKPQSKSNCPYYPYFIYKILELQLTGVRNKRRRTRILSCIHLQSRETLIENDRTWRSIVKIMCARQKNSGRTRLRPGQIKWRYIPTKAR